MAHSCTCHSVKLCVPQLRVKSYCTSDVKGTETLLSGFERNSPNGFSFQLILRTWFQARCFMERDENHHMNINLSSPSPPKRPAKKDSPMPHEAEQRFLRSQVAMCDLWLGERYAWADAFACRFLVPKVYRAWCRALQRYSACTKRPGWKGFDNKLYFHMSTSKLRKFWEDEPTPPAASSQKLPALLALALPLEPRNERPLVVSW